MMRAGQSVHHERGQIGEPDEKERRQEQSAYCGADDCGDEALWYNTIIEKMGLESAFMNRHKQFVKPITWV